MGDPIRNAKTVDMTSPYVVDFILALANTTLIGNEKEQYEAHKKLKALINHNSGVFKLLGALANAGRLEKNSFLSSLYSAFLNPDSFATKLVKFFMSSEPPEKGAVDALTESTVKYFGLGETHSKALGHDLVISNQTLKDIESLLGGKIENPPSNEEIKIAMGVRTNEAAFKKAEEVLKKIREIRYEKARMVLK